jgi:hypothetical protein
MHGDLLTQRQYFADARAHRRGKIKPDEPRRDCATPNSTRDFMCGQNRFNNICLMIQVELLHDNNKFIVK